MANVRSDVLDPVHLSALLRAAGELDNDQIAQVVVESERQTLVSTTRRLRVDLDGGSRRLRLFLKAPRTDSGIDITSSREAAFYMHVAPLSPPDLLPRCFDAADGDAAGWHVLLEDLTDSHEVVTEWPIPPLPVERRHVVERLMANASRLFAERYLPRRRLTIVHGDAHVWNALCPKDPARGDVRLIDWDGWRIGVAARDLAYMIALHWYPDRRRRFERRCLEHYHAILVESGVHGYDFDALWLDYRRSVLCHVMTPIWQAAIKLGPWIWFGHFERTMMAVDDLGCLELLD